MNENVIAWLTSEKKETRTLQRLLFWLLIGVFVFYDHFVSLDGYSSELSYNLYLNIAYCLANILAFVIFYYGLIYFLKWAYIKKNAIYVLSILTGFFFLTEIYFYYFYQYLATFSNTESFYIVYYDIGHLKFPQLLFNRKVFFYTLAIEFFYIFIIFSGKLSFESLVYVYKNKKIKTENLNLELEFLRSQVNPHFLFNTLNNIFSLVEENEKGSKAVLKLSNLMRYSLYESNKLKTKLVKEIEFIEDYINLEKLSLDQEVVKVKYQRTGEPGELKIPPLILLSFIENAFKNIVKEPKGGWLSILLVINGNNLIFTVENSWSKLIQTSGLKEETGNNLVKTERFLSQSYAKDDYSIETISSLDSFAVKLELAL